MFCTTCAINALSIDCGEYYNYESDVTVNSELRFDYYSCDGTVRAYESNSSVTEIFGMHMHGWNSSCVERFVLTNQNMTSFPTGFENFFPNLQDIILSFNSISHIENGHLSPYNNSFSILFMDHNQISYLESSLFNGLGNLVIVNFNHNNIKYVGYNIELPKRLNLKNNTCIDEEFPQSPYVFDFYSSSLQKHNFTHRLQHQCMPSQPITIILESEGKSTIFIDHTQEKGSDTTTEEPSIKTKVPKLGESFWCINQMMRKVELTKRCREMFGNDEHLNAFE